MTYFPQNKLQFTLLIVCVVLIVFSLSTCSTTFVPDENQAPSLPADNLSPAQETDNLSISVSPSSDIGTEPSPEVIPEQVSPAGTDDPPSSPSADIPGRPDDVPSSEMESPSPSEMESPSSSEAEYVSVLAEGPDGLIFDETVEFFGDMTALDALLAACAQTETGVEIRGKGGIAYVVSIFEFREFGGGPLSGWVFKVNGVMSSVGTGAAVLSPGDMVSFYYSLDLGADAADKP